MTIDPDGAFVFIRRAERVLSPMKQRERCAVNFSTDPAILHRQVTMENRCPCAA